VAGVQELWFFVFALLFLHAFARRSSAAAVFLVLALLSKEPAAVLGPLALLWALRVDREPLGRALRRVAPLLVVTAVWVALHPRILGRLWGPYMHTLESSVRPSLPVIAGKTVLALFGLDQLPRPESGFEAAFMRGLAGALALVVIAAWTAWPRRRAPGATEPAATPEIPSLAIGWTAMGSIVVFMPSISWQAYYGLFGAFGFWLAVMHALRRRAWIAVAVVAALALLRPLRADTPSWDWASETFQRRAGFFLRTLRDDLLRKKPTMPSHARLYFARVPNRIGWIAGDGPALRIWYRDSTLTGGYYSYYTPRAQGAPPGPDYFFRFDESGTWVEVVRGPEDPRARRAGWEQDHRELAHLLGGAGDWNGAAEELVKLADASPENSEYPLNAGVCFEKLGDSLTAARLYARAASLPGASAAAREAAARSQRFMPPAGAQRGADASASRAKPRPR
jgi:hypothetical protein